MLVDRVGSPDGPHPAAARSGPAARIFALNQAPLYDPSLDLSIRAPTGEVAAYALFSFDPVTLVGLVEPMRTEDAWQRRGLARTLLAIGVDRLARRGATRIKVSFVNPAAGALYLGCGFEIESTATTYSRDRHG